MKEVSGQAEKVTASTTQLSALSGRMHTIQTKQHDKPLC